jgi:monomeric isocitrate dehydrogenase
MAGATMDDGDFRAPESPRSPARGDDARIELSPDGSHQVTRAALPVLLARQIVDAAVLRPSSTFLAARSRTPRRWAWQFSVAPQDPMMKVLGPDQCFGRADRSAVLPSCASPRTRQELASVGGDPDGDEPDQHRKLAAAVETPSA